MKLITGYALAACLAVACAKQPDRLAAATSDLATHASTAPAPDLPRLPDRPSLKLAVLDAPFNLGLRPPAPGREPGTRRLAQALRANDLVARLGATDRGVVPAPPYAFVSDSKTRIYNAAAIRAYSEILAKRVQSITEQGELALVLGGDCSILVGSLMAPPVRGRRGLVFMDAHTDFGPPPAVGAGIELALVTGHGPEGMREFADRSPLVRERDVVMFGPRDEDDLRELRGQTKLRILDFASIRHKGAKESAREALAYLRAQGVDELWIHLDADVLDDAIMPAVDSRGPGGLSYAELRDSVSELVASGMVRGVDVTVFDPDRDPKGDMARAFTSALVETFRR
ncbi:arginase family protein [Pendulispora albinea]|uniref:Arginase family protein n=1 Tax=Pendulispora albinea TaxID=2741071 RepID=A0ABZ2M3R9_9BACT